MSKNASFKVDPKLAELLGESYRSTEEAIKELVDNAHDADADNVWITLPTSMTETHPEVVVKDDGTGMKEQEVRKEYLKIASSRYSRKGAKTNIKKRQVKGKKGIGKFAGLMVADFMQLTTVSGGNQTTLKVNKPDLAKAKYDLEKVPLPVEVVPCDKAIHGTTVLLTGLNQNLNYPNPEALKQLLVWDYGRSHDIAIHVNGERIGIQDYDGKTYTKEIQLENGKKATLHYTICEKPPKQAGIVLRVGNKIVGRPENLLKDDEIIPEKLQKRVVGELVCDDLEDDMTSDGSAIFENSKLLEAVKEPSKAELAKSMDETFKTEMHLARQRYQQKINRALEKLPEFKRPFAEKSLQKVLEKFYGETDERLSTLISVMVDSLEKDYYWTVVENIEKSRDGDVEKFADALLDFGLLELSMISTQAANRSRFLDELDLLRSNGGTLEATMHKALAKNLWVLGNQYSMVFSNRTLAKAVEDVLGKMYSGADAANRPDLFLGETIERKYLLIEFKRPSKTVGRDDENQALKYRDALNKVLHNVQIDIIVMGKNVDVSIDSQNERRDVRFLSYSAVISTARTSLNWLLRELKTEGTFEPEAVEAEG